VILRFKSDQGLRFWKRSQGLAIKLHCVREGCNTRQILSQSDPGVLKRNVGCEILDAFFVRPSILVDMLYSH
jgi:hypothetical protein